MKVTVSTDNERPKRCSFWEVGRLSCLRMSQKTCQVP